MSFRRYIIAAAIACAVLSAALFIKPGLTESVKGNYTGAPCEPHMVPDSLCTRCHPDLIALFREKFDWCSEHKLPESQCYLCNPELAKTKSPSETPSPIQGSMSDKAGAAKPDAPVELDWCAEHRVPESQCTNCNPQLVDGFKAKFDWCGSHGVPESHCYQCNPKLKFPQEAEYERRKQEGAKKTEGKPQTSLFRTNAVKCATNDAVIQLASVQSAARSGLEFSLVGEVPSVDQIEAPGETDFAPTASAIVTSLATGTLVRWAASPGQPISKNQIIAYLQSVEAAGICAEFLHAKAILKLNESNFARKQELSRSGLATARELLDSETEVERARADHHKALVCLSVIGFSDDEIARIGNPGFQSTLLPVRSMRSGTLIELKAELGSVIEAGQPLAQVAEPSSLVVTARLRESDLSKVRPGQKVAVSADGSALQREGGEVIWVSDAIDPVTRSASVQIRIKSNGSRLKAKQYVRVVIDTEALQGRVVVPESAVQWEGCCNVVFVAETPDRIRPRKIAVEYANGNNYVVTGVEPGLRIVTRGSYILKTELMKEGIGAGCSGHVGG